MTLRVSVELSPPPLKITSCAYSHLAYTFSPCIHILTSCAPLHHSKSPRIHILTSHTHSHLAYTFSPHIHILTSCAPLHHSKSPRIHILTLRTHSHLAYIFSPRVPPPPFKVTSCTHSHVVYTFSPRVHILNSCAPSTTQSHLVPTSSTHSHLTYIFSPRVLPSTQNNIFHLAWKNSQKSHAATPIPSIRYLLRATKYLCKLQFSLFFFHFCKKNSNVILNVHRCH